MVNQYIDVHPKLLQLISPLQTRHLSTLELLADVIYPLVV